jgi:hypothetical protein
MTSRIAFLECGGNPEVAFWGRRLWLWTALILPAAIKPRLWSIRPPMCCSGADRKPLTCRAFARLMVLDQMELESQLAALATENGVQLPNGPSEQAKQEMATLQEMSGAKLRWHRHHDGIELRASGRRRVSQIGEPFLRRIESNRSTSDAPEAFCSRIRSSF